MKLNETKSAPIVILSEETFCDLLYSSLPADQRPSKVAPPPAIPPTIAAASAAGGAAAGSVSSSNAIVQSSRLWVDRHAPSDFGHFLGNAKELQMLDNWLRNWETTQAAVRADMKEGGKVKKSTLPPRAALLSGPPGIGKTTAATLLVS